MGATEAAETEVTETTEVEEMAEVEEVAKAMMIWSSNKHGKCSTDGNVHYDGFAKGYKSLGPNVTDKMVDDAWKIANYDGGYMLNKEKFRRIYEIGGGPPKNDEEKPDWYWRHFALDTYRPSEFEQ